MYYRKTLMCISWTILYYCDILVFYISVIYILYLCAGGYKCRLTTFPTRFAHGWCLFCDVVIALLWCNCCTMRK